MGLEYDPRLELLPPPPSLTSVFRDGHAHFFAPLWRKKDVWEPINPSCTCARVSDSHPDTGSQPPSTAPAHLCLLTTRPRKIPWKMHCMVSQEIISPHIVTNTENPCTFCTPTSLRDNNNVIITTGVWEHLWRVIYLMWPWQLSFYKTYPPSYMPVGQMW